MGTHWVADGSGGKCLDLAVNATLSMAVKAASAPACDEHGTVNLRPSKGDCFTWDANSSLVRAPKGVCADDNRCLRSTDGAGVALGDCASEDAQGFVQA